MDLTPTQIVIATITTDTNPYAEEVFKLFKENNLRTVIDIRNEKIGYKIREHSNAKIPVLIIIGKQEAENQKASSTEASKIQDAKIKGAKDSRSLQYNKTSNLMGMASGEAQAAGAAKDAAAQAQGDAIKGVGSAIAGGVAG